MGKRIDAIGPELQAFIEKQHVFFVASAPLAGDGHVNLSPKGLDTFRVLGPREVAYLDLTGSGNETAAHVAENGRLTVMFCGFEKQAQIVRLYCRARVALPGTPEWERARDLFPAFMGERQLIFGDVEFVQSSCGFGVPRMEMIGERDQLVRWAESKGEDAMAEYRRTRNAVSLDGLAAPAPEGR